MLGSAGMLECNAGAISESVSISSCAETKAMTVQNSDVGYSIEVHAFAALGLWVTGSLIWSPGLIKSYRAEK